MRVELEGGALCFKNTSKSTDNTPQNKQETSEYLNNHFGTGKIAITTQRCKKMHFTDKFVLY